MSPIHDVLSLIVERNIWSEQSGIPGDDIEKRSPNKQFRQIFWEMNPEKMSNVI